MPVLVTRKNQGRARALARQSLAVYSGHVKGLAGGQLYEQATEWAVIRTGKRVFYGSPDEYQNWHGEKYPRRLSF
jgi:hypothetical protein